MTITVTTDDVAARWQPLTPAQQELASVLIDDAIEILTAALPTLEAAVPGTVSEELVVRVVASMVLRVLKNPDGLRQEAIAGYSYTRDQALSDGSLYLSDLERQQLATALGTACGAAFTIRPYGAPDTDLTTF
jgi:hypothetical protein